MLLENDRVRVFEVRLMPGNKTDLRKYQDGVMYLLGDSRLRLTDELGKQEVVELRAGQALFQPEHMDAAENIGKKESRALFVELRE